MPVDLQQLLDAYDETNKFAQFGDGRPKGSKNKATLIKEGIQPAPMSAAPRRSRRRSDKDMQAIRDTWHSFFADLQTNGRWNERIRGTNKWAGYPDVNKRKPYRAESDMLWKALGIHFNKSRDGRKSEQGCESDSKCLRDVLIRDLDAFDRDMMVKMASLVDFIMLSDASANTWFTPVKKYAATLGHMSAAWREEIADILKMSQGRKARLMQNQAAAVYKKNRQGINVNYQAVKTQVRKWIDSDAWEDKLLAVMAAIGPRKTAILDSRIKFTPAVQPGHDKRYWIVQNGVLKDRSSSFKLDDDGATVFDGGKAPEKPIVFGLTYDEIKAAIKYIRAKIAPYYAQYSKRGPDGIVEVDRAALGASVSRQLVSRLKSAFNFKDMRIGTHFLRMIYANVAYHFYGEQLGMSLSAFIASVLAHNETSLSTALAYQGVNVQYGLPDNIGKSSKAVLESLTTDVASYKRKIDELEARLKGDKLWADKPLSEYASDDDTGVSTVPARIVHRRRIGRDHIKLKDKNGIEFVIKFQPKGKRVRLPLNERIEMARGAIRGLIRAGVNPIRQRLVDMGFDGQTVAAPALAAEGIARKKARTINNEVPPV